MTNKVKSILVSHSPPKDDSSPYHLLAKEWGIHVDFKSFVHIEGLSTSEFRKQNVNPLDFSGIIFSNKSAMDHFFRICKDLRVEMPAETKYFCVSDAAAKYLQKYITIRKRKLYIGEKRLSDLYALLKKFNKDKVLFPAGESGNVEMQDFAENNHLSIKSAIVYHTVPSDIKGVLEKNYDMICFFSPASIESLFYNFPTFAQNETLIAVFGTQTAKAAKEYGLRLDITAPRPEVPSMTMAIKEYLTNNA